MMLWHLRMNSLSGYIQTWQIRKRQYIHMKKNSKENTPDSHKVDDSIKALIMEYIDAHNNGEHAKAEVLLHNIKEMRRLCDGC